MRKVFFSFHFDGDVMRTQLVRNMGSFEKKEPIKANEWEKVTKGGKDEVEKWIDKNLLNKDCLVVLIGEETSSRPWVDLEIRKAWRAKIPAIGVYIHNLECPNKGFGKKGKDPFEKISISDGTKMSDHVKVYNPDSGDAYNDIAENLTDWIEKAIQSKNKK